MIKSAQTLNYCLHHLCIYDDKPRESMMPYLRWHHAITNFFSGEVFHVTGEGHSDYTFMAVGGHAYQVQIEAPPFQFEYERNWWATHGKGYNHVCWLTSDAESSMKQLLSEGATEVMPFEHFPTYDGFVVHDPEGHWIEIMEYTHERFQVNELMHAPSGECGLEMVGHAAICRDVPAMVDWYTRVMGMTVAAEYKQDELHSVVLIDERYQPETRRSMLILQNPQTPDQRSRFETHGPYISDILYQAYDLQRAWDDAIWAGFKPLYELSIDPVTNLKTAYLLEPCGGNVVRLTEHYAP